MVSGNNWICASYLLENRSCWKLVKQLVCFSFSATVMRIHPPQYEPKIGHTKQLKTHPPYKCDRIRIIHAQSMRNYCQWAKVRLYQAVSARARLIPARDFSSFVHFRIWPLPSLKLNPQSKCSLASDRDVPLGPAPFTTAMSDKAYAKLSRFS